mgnify:CR=1 FL=1
MLGSPELPSCGDCQKWLYDPDRGWAKTIKGHGKRARPVARPKGVPTPCHRCPKIPKGKEPKPENAVELSGKNRRAWLYFAKCQVDKLGLIPQDEITVKNNALIWMLLDSIQREQLGLIPTVFLSGVGRR